MAISKSQATLALSGLTVISVPAITLAVMNTSLSKEEKIITTSSNTAWKRIKEKEGMLETLKYELCGISSGWNAPNNSNEACSYLNKRWNLITKDKKFEDKLNHWKNFLKNIEGIANGI